MKTVEDFLAEKDPSGQIYIYEQDRWYTHYTESDIIELMKAYGDYCKRQGISDGMSFGRENLKADLRDLLGIETPEQ